MYDYDSWKGRLFLDNVDLPGCPRVENAGQRSKLGSKGPRWGQVEGMGSLDTPGGNP